MAFPLILSLVISQAHASLVSIHIPKRGATVPLGPLEVKGTAIQSNSTLKNCIVAVKTNKAPYDNATPVSPGNFSKWSFISNQTAPGLNQIEAQITCTKSDGSLLIKHNVHAFNVTGNVTANPTPAVTKARSPFIKEMNATNQTKPQTANLTNQLVPKDFDVGTANTSRPIQDNMTNITGAIPTPAPVTKVTNRPNVTNVTNVTQPPLAPKVDSNVSKPLQTQQTSQTLTTKAPMKPHQQGLSILTMPHISGHHKVIHIHIST